MKKVFVSMMLATALLTGSSLYAQTPVDGNTGATTQKECCPKDKGSKGDKMKKGNKAGKAPRQQFNPFDGVQLTPDQEQKLQILQQGLGPVVLDKEQQEKIKQNPNLTPEEKKQLREEREAKKLEQKKNYLQGVKETLTPEQYVIFLENVYLYTPQGQGNDKGVRPGKAGMRSPKGDKNGKMKKEKPANK